HGAEVGGETVEDFGPNLEDGVGFGVAALEHLLGLGVEHRQKFNGVGELAVGERNAPGWAQRAREEAQGSDSVLKDDGGQFVGVEEVEDESGGADLQENA